MSFCLRFFEAEDTGYIFLFHCRKERSLVTYFSLSLSSLSFFFVLQ